MKGSDNFVTEIRYAQLRMLDYLQKHWWLCLAEGVFFILLGSAAIVIPQVISVVIVIFLGWILVVAGAMYISRGVFFREMPGYSLWLCLGVLQIAMGYLLIADPIAGVLTLTMVMALFFALEGSIKIYLAFILRPSPQWRAVLFSGVTALVFAMIVLVFWTETEHWLLGLFLGINMIVLGWLMVKMGLQQKVKY